MQPTSQREKRRPHLHSLVRRGNENEFARERESEKTFDRNVLMLQPLCVCVCMFVCRQLICHYHRHNYCKQQCREYTASIVVALIALVFICFSSQAVCWSFHSLRWSHAQHFLPHSLVSNWIQSIHWQHFYSRIRVYYKVGTTIISSSRTKTSVLLNGKKKRKKKKNGAWLAGKSSKKLSRVQWKMPKESVVE